MIPNHHLKFYLTLLLEQHKKHNYLIYYPKHNIKNAKDSKDASFTNPLKVDFKKKKSFNLSEIMRNFLRIMEYYLKRSYKHRESRSL